MIQRDVSLFCCRVLPFVVLLGAGVVWQGGDADARTRVTQRFLIQILVQTPRRFSVPNVKVYAEGQLLGATDRYGIFVGFFDGYKGQRVTIAVRKRAVKFKADRKVRLRTKTTGTAILPEPVKLRFRIRGAKSGGRLKAFPIRVFALTPDRVGISKARVMIDGKIVGRTNKFGLWVGRFRSEVGEVIQIKVVGRGKNNHASKPARLRMTRKGLPAVVKFHAYIRP